MNTRLQVEHPVTELRYGVDLVAAFTVAGPRCNLPFHAELLEHPESSPAITTPPW